MSLAGFDNLRSKHADAAVQIAAIEQAIHRMLSADPHAVIDDRILRQVTNVESRTVEDFLAELVQWNALSEVWFWECPTTRGTVMEAESFASFPDVIECDKCGGRHNFAEEDTTVLFLATPELLRSLRGATPPGSR